MLSITEAQVTFATTFTQEITVFSEEVDPETGETSQIPSTEVPTVTASFVDPGVTITASPGKVILAGMYKKIIITTWEYINQAGNVVSQQTVPDLGTFKKITKVDSPARMKETCTYTIGNETFVHTVDLGSYTVVADTLKSLLATVP